jgi:hypothetical protein
METRGSVFETKLFLMDPQPPNPEETPSSTGASESHSTSEHLRDALSRAWYRGAEDARSTAREAIPRVRLAAAEFAADLLHGFGYGVSFAATCLDHLGANDARFSSERGMTAGRVAAEELIGRFARRNPAPPPDQPGEEPQTVS